MLEQTNTDLYSNLKIDSLLASGMTADVFLADLEGVKVVVKIFKKKNEQFYYNEVGFLKKMTQSNSLIKIHGYGQVTKVKDKFFQDHYIVMDYAKNGDLVNFIETKGAKSEGEVKNILMKIIAGINDIHKAGFVHRDIKPENILIGDNNEMLLTDFGFVEKSTNISKEMKGTQGYIPPEVLNKKTKLIPEALDVFSLGVVAFILATGEFPFDTPTNEDPLYGLILDNDWEEYWKIVDNVQLTKGFKDMIQKMICPNPVNRLSIDQLINHSWFKHH